METTKILRSAILISLIMCCPRPWGEAQKKIPATEYDYYSLATTSIADITAEASKLPNIPQRVMLLIEAAKILQSAKKEESVRLLEVVLHDLKEWGSADAASWRQRNMAATLRNEALAVYALVDAEKALVRQKEFQSSEESNASNSSTAINFKNDSWRDHFNERQTAADQAAKVAFSLTDTEPEKALELVVQSLQGGTVSGDLFYIFEKLLQNGNRAFLDRLENKISQVLTTTITLDPSSLSSASIIGLVDKDMPQAAKNAFASFVMRSLEAWAILAKEPGIDEYYITRGFSVFSGNVRLMISQHAPDQLLEFDLLLDQTAPLVPERMRSIVQRLPPETSSDPKERLNEILKEPVADRRDLRLNRFVSELLRHESDDAEKRFDLAADAINAFTDTDAKSAYTDRLTVTRTNALVKQKKFIEAQQLAVSLSSEETRAWAMLAIATVAAKDDKVLGFESITKALKTLDAASPSPYKTELALLATAMLAKDDSRRAFETFSIAAKYANSFTPKNSSRTKPPFAFGLETKIGEMQTRLGVVPPSLSETSIDPTLSGLATTDWFRADQITKEIHDPSLRLRLRLLFAGAILAQDARPKKSQASPKAPTRN